VRALDRIVGQHLHRVGGSSVALALERLVRVGDPHPLVYAMLLAALLCYGRGHASTLRFVAFMIVGTFALELGFKSLFHYVRPGSFLGLDLSGYPSGTAMRATVLAGALLTIGGSACHRTWQRGILVSAAVGWPLVVAVALVLSGDHTPSEVVGGLLIGTVWLGVCLRLAIPARE
jgi:undecaprenyl-diphosphatase